MARDSAKAESQHSASVTATAAVAMAKATVGARVSVRNDWEPDAGDSRKIEVPHRWIFVDKLPYTPAARPLRLPRMGNDAELDRRPITVHPHSSSNLVER